MSTEKKKKDITSVPVMHPIMEKGKILSTQFLLFYQTVIIILPPNFQRTLTNCRLKARQLIMVCVSFILFHQNIRLT